MDMATAIASVNWIAITLAAFSALAIGGIWYGPLFARPWMAANQFDEAYLAARPQTPMFVGSFVLCFIMALNLALFLGPQAGIAFGAAAGFFAGAGWIAAMLGVLYLFESRGLRLFLVNGGYATVALTVMGVIIGAFNPVTGG